MEDELEVRFEGEADNWPEEVKQKMLDAILADMHKDKKIDSHPLDRPPAS